MKISKVTVFGLCILCLGGILNASPSPVHISTASNIQQSQSRAVNIGQTGYKKGEVIIKYKENMSISQVTASIRNGTNINIRTTFKALSKFTGNVYAVVKSGSLTTEELLAKMTADPNVEYAEPNYIYHASNTPNDPDYNLLWGQNNTGQSVLGTVGTDDADIDAPEAWNKTTGSSDTVIAVIDTGVDYTHEDLTANMWTNPNEIPNNGIDDDGNGYVDDIHGIDAINDTGDPMDQMIDNGGHGTHVAGTIAAVGNNGKGVVGVSWKSKIMALKFLSVNGGYTSDAIKCLNYVIAQKAAGVNIVATNNSWGGGGYSEALSDAIAASNEAGILFIAAAGNGGDDGIGDNNDAVSYYPSGYTLSGIISVAATDADDNLADFSNYGETSVDLSAPGTLILSSLPPTYLPGSSDIFFDDMENGIGNWVAGGANNAWAITTDQELFDNPDFPVPSPTHFLSDSPGVNYPSNEDWWIALDHDIDLSVYSEDLYIGFGAAIYLSQNSDGSISDYATIEISNDSGVTWKSLYNLGVYARYWYSPYSLRIPNDYKTANFRLRFRMRTTSNDGKPGWLIDNVGIGSALNAYGYKSGTSMAAPQVTGAVALRVSLCTKEEAADIRQDIFNSVDLKDSLTGKVATEGRLNVNSLINTECPVKEDSVIVPILYLLL